MSKPIDTLRTVLFPLSWLYGLVIFFRNKFYDWGVFKSESFSIPVICVGNITVGGTGKTPHVEYLIREYSKDYKLAILSRGYGRKTKGFRYVTLTATADMVGDEPLQMKQKFPEVTFAVDENRVRGIQKLEAEGYDLVILDDAFQHRAATPSQSIVLLDYNRLPHKDSYLPSGNLREGCYALRRASCVLITKCPKQLSEAEKIRIIRKNKVTASCLFTHFEYSAIHAFDGGVMEGELKGRQVLLVTGIANPSPLVNYLKLEGASVEQLNYPDHYNFAQKDLEHIGREFEKLSNSDAIILTTEKDKVKLLPLLASMSEFAFTFHYIAIQVAFEKGQESVFRDTLDI